MTIDLFEPNTQSVKLLMRCLGELLLRVVGTNGDKVNVTGSSTDYVIEGGVFKLTSSTGTYPIWVGVNAARLFFITYVVADPATAENTFQFCFGGASKVGWSFNYEPIHHAPGTVSVWGTCMTKDGGLTFLDAANKISLTEQGDFWLRDIAMMTQSLVRTCERSGIKAPDGLLPAPL